MATIKLKFHPPARLITLPFSSRCKNLSLSLITAISLHSANGRVPSPDGVDSLPPFGISHVRGGECFPRGVDETPYEIAIFVLARASGISVTSSPTIANFGRSLSPSRALTRCSRGSQVPPSHSSEHARTGKRGLREESD